MKRFIVALVALITTLALAGCFGSSSSGGSAAHRQHPVGWGSIHAPQNLQLTAGGTATMWDTVTLDTVPSNPFALGGYTSGYWPTYLPLRARWPRAHTISIAINASHHADCLDVEPQDAEPYQAAAWVRADIAAGFKKPCVYSSYYEFVHQVQPALRAAGVSRSSVFEWDADYTYTRHLDSGFDATQWTDRAYGSNLDESLVTLPFLSIAQPPLNPTPPPPPPKPKPPADPFHYKIFSKDLHKVPHLGTFSELSAVLAYDGARKHAAKYATFLKKTLEPELLILANQIIRRVNSETKFCTDVASCAPNWTKFNRGERQLLLRARAQGRKLA